MIERGKLQERVSATVGPAPAASAGASRPTFVRADSFRRRMILAVLFPLGLMACLAGMLAWHVQEQDESFLKTDQAATCVSDSRAVVAQLRDSDLILRTYLVSESTPDLQQFRKDQPAIDQGFAKLKQDLSPDTDPHLRSRVANASSAYQAWADNAKAMLARRAAGENTQSAEFALRSLALVDDVRKQISPFISAEDNQRTARSAAANRATQRTFFAALVLALLSGLVLSLFTIRQLTGLSRNYRGALDVLRREGNERARAEQELRAVVNEARCILWGAEIFVEGDWREQIKQGAHPFLWNTALTDEAGAARVMPLDVPAAGRYIDVFNASRNPDDVRQMEHTSALAMLNGDGSYSHEFRCTDRDGRMRWMREDVSLQPAGEGRWRAIGVVTDVTARHDADSERRDLLLREQRARADSEIANRRKDQFLAVLSHELRTPLTPVLARVMLLKRDPSLSPDVHQALDMIRRNIELEARLIDDLLDSTRLSSGKMKLNLQSIDLHQRLTQTAEGFADQIGAKQLRLKMDLAATRTAVRADPVRLQQIFWNLIGNAVKYTPAGGTIALHTHNITGASRDDGPLVFEISDTGVGIDAPTLARLFKPFEQGEQTLIRRFGGLGLGLSISRSLLEMQGGTLTAASPGPGQGATFTLTLPVAAAAPAASPMRLPRRQTILLVEDNEDTLRVLSRLLRQSGYTVKTAATVGAALAQIDDEVDLVISDIGLPDGNGWELMRTLKTRWTIPGIALSGFAQQEDVERSRSVGFARHLAKPINPQELEAAIEQVTAERAA
ncbi:MAG TPA: ATP-binding protein [Tepidisphaeraceae bacterium]|jgi:signal transduction histidine kinase/CHASE3 domain sensor protein|nr:ATP-binding protein [Tepidisphaeraceae bacterium]